MQLHKLSSLNELAEYARLCHEHGIKRVKLDADTYRRVKQINPFVSGKNLAYFGVQFVSR